MDRRKRPYYDFAKHEVVIDVSKSSLREDLFYSANIVRGLNVRDENLEVDRKSIIEQLKREQWKPEPTVQMLETAECTKQRLAVPLDQAGGVKLQVFLDASIIEVFINDSKCLTQRIYPKYADSDRVKWLVNSGKAWIRNCKAWQISPTNSW